MRRNVYRFLGGLFLVTSAALGQGSDDALVGDRPDFTESAVTISKNRVQIEAGLTATESGDSKTREFGEVLIRLGLSSKLELRIGLDSFAKIEEGRRDIDGFGDASLGVKIALGEARGWTTAVLAIATLPTGSTEFREPHPQPQVVYAAERDLNDGLSLGTNVGMTHASSDGDQFVELSASGALGWGLTDKLGAFFELYGIVPFAEREAETYFVDTGLTYRLTPDFQLDARVGAGLNGAADNWFVGAGVVWRR